MSDMSESQPAIQKHVPKAQRHHFPEILTAEHCVVLRGESWVV